MVPRRAPDAVAAFTAAAFHTAEVRRAEFIRAAQNTARVIGQVAATRENVAANYRRMAQQPGPHSDRYLQRAEQLDRSAARARRFAEQELQTAHRMGTTGALDHTTA